MTENMTKQYGFRDNIIWIWALTFLLTIGGDLISLIPINYTLFSDAYTETFNLYITFWGIWFVFLIAILRIKDNRYILDALKYQKNGNNIKNLMIDLPYLFGGEEVFKKAYVDGLNEESKNALDNLKRIYELLCLYGFEKYVSIDLGMLESIDYYTGSIFKCYTHGVGFPICAGGRYDNLMGQFGDNKGAVGAAIGINRLISVLSDKEVHDVSASLVFAEKNAEGIAYDIAYNLRVNGCLVEMYIGDGDYKAAEEYSKGKNIGAMLRVFPNGQLMINDFAKHEIIETTANEFLGYYDESMMFDEHDHCGCGCDHDHEHEHHHDHCDCGHEH